MITFQKLNHQEPYKEFKKKYDEAILHNQSSVEAISISSFSHIKNEVDSRYVNLKFIDNDKFIFFTNYKSPKSVQFASHDQISALIFWPKVNTQIRMKARIEKISATCSNDYFKKRSESKNALAISSNQSNEINSYKEIVDEYNLTLKSEIDLTLRPEYWGGFAFKPYSFEFWEGHSLRLNKRVAYNFLNNRWNKIILQP